MAMTTPPPPPGGRSFNGFVPSYVHSQCVENLNQRHHRSNCNILDYEFVMPSVESHIKYLLGTFSKKEKKSIYWVKLGLYKGS